MNLAETFVHYLEDIGYGTFDEDLFLHRVPATAQVDAAWWVKPSGGSPVGKNTTGEINKSFQLDIFRRHRSASTLYDDLYQLEAELSGGCVELPGFQVVELNTTTYPDDQDLDQEDRRVGLLQVNLTIYKENSNGIS